MGGVIIDGRIRWDGNNGGRLGIWKANIDVIRTIIMKNKIEPIIAKTVITGELRITRSALRWPKIPYPGIPAPHLHYGNKIYPINEAQWKQFSAGVIRNIQGKLRKIGTVQPEGLAAVSEVVSNLRTVSKGRQKK